MESFALALVIALSRRFPDMANDERARKAKLAKCSGKIDRKMRST